MLLAHKICHYLKYSKNDILIAQQIALIMKINIDVMVDSSSEILILISQRILITRLKLNTRLKLIYD